MKMFLARNKVSCRRDRKQEKNEDGKFYSLKMTNIMKLLSH